VRELRNVLERAAILCDGGLVTGDHLALDHLEPAGGAAMSVAAAAMPTGSDAAQPVSANDLPAMERAMIEQALCGARFNKTRAARALGLTRRQLYSRLRKYGFE
jgi:DNA-binding NtrC family response regulator